MKLKKHLKITKSKLTLVHFAVLRALPADVPLPETHCLKYWNNYLFYYYYKYKLTVIDPFFAALDNHLPHHPKRISRPCHWLIVISLPHTFVLLCFEFLPRGHIVMMLQKHGFKIAEASSSTLANNNDIARYGLKTREKDPFRKSAVPFDTFFSNTELVVMTPIE